MSSQNNCPCGLPKEYQDCCGSVHNKTNTANTAEELMRSRYSAFVKSDGNYLHNSHYSKTRPSLKEMLETAEWAKTVSWIKLEVLEKSKGLNSDKEGTVYFKAYFLNNGEVEIIEEHSFFIKENGVWYYEGRV